MCYLVKGFLKIEMFFELIGLENSYFALTVPLEDGFFKEIPKKHFKSQFSTS